MPETNDLGDGAPHGYLGAVQDVEGPATLLEVGQQLMLPFLSMPGLVLTPGDTIPLRLLSVRLRRLVEAALAAPPPLARLLAVCITHSGDDQRSVLHDYHADVSHTVGCIAEVQQAGADGVLARGLQRCTVDLRFVSLEEHDSGRHVRATVLAEDMPAAGPAMGAQSPAFWPAAMWQRVDPQSLAATASQMCAEAMPQVRLPSARDPLGLSFWLNRNLPLDNRTRQRVLEQPSAAHRLIRQIALLRTMGGIFCLGCQEEVASCSGLIHLSSFGGCGVHFVNPHSWVYHVVTVDRAECELAGEATEQDTWFPGARTWRIAGHARRHRPAHSPTWIAPSPPLPLQGSPGPAPTALAATTTWAGTSGAWQARASPSSLWGCAPARPRRPRRPAQRQAAAPRRRTMARAAARVASGTSWASTCARRWPGSGRCACSCDKSRRSSGRRPRSRCPDS